MSKYKTNPLLQALPTGIHLGGWRPATGGRALDVIAPATGEVVATIADAGREDAPVALNLAVKAMPAWAARTAFDRADLLHAAQRRVLEIADDLAVVISAESGKTLAEARGEVAYGAQYLRWYAEEAVRIGGRVTASPDGRTDVVVERQPVGPCLLITPWNFPFALAARKIAPALAAGNTIIVKPSELTPLATSVLVQVLLEVGVPADVVSLLNSTTPAEISAPLLADTRLRKVSFTGSTAVGRLLHEQASQHFTKLSLELGGDSPVLVLDDADLDKAVEGVMVAKFRNSGQSCIAANRILVQDGIADAFTARLAERITALRVDDGLTEGVDVGAVINAQAREKCQAVVDEAVANGATVLAQTSVPDTGTFVPATLVADVPLDSRVVGQEIFGPVAMVSRFTTDEVGLDEANRTPYGLAAYVFTQDLDRARRISRGFHSGMVGINVGSVANVAAPFGGIGDSGVGREGGAEGLEEYLHLRYVATGRA